MEITFFYDSQYISSNKNIFLLAIFLKMRKKKSKREKKEPKRQKNKK
jgi:hypothetical protein